MVLTNSLQASLYLTLYIVWIKSQPEVEDLPIVTMVVADSCPTREALPHRMIRSRPWCHDTLSSGMYSRMMARLSP